VELVAARTCEQAVQQAAAQAVQLASLEAVAQVEPHLCRREI